MKEVEYFKNLFEKLIVILRDEASMLLINVEKTRDKVNHDIEWCVITVYLYAYNVQRNFRLHSWTHRLTVFNHI